MEDLLVRLVGYIATVLHGDAAVFDRWLWLRKHILRGPRRTLDAGCGTGAFAMYAAKAGNEVVGISFHPRENEVAARRARILGLTNIRFVTGNLGELSAMRAALGSFDQVICFETMEHIMDDRKLLRDLASILRPGGRLLLTVPHLHYHRMPGDSISKVEDGRHVRWGYTPEQLRKMFEEVGLKVQTTEYLTGYAVQHAIQAERAVLKVLGPRLAWLITFPLRLGRIIDPLLMRLTSYPAFTVGVVGEKPINA